MKDYKINLSMLKGEDREAVSRIVQKKAFRLGCGWGRTDNTCQYMNKPYLIFRHPFIYWGRANTDTEEISIQDFMQLPELDTTITFADGHTVELSAESYRNLRGES